MTITVQQAIEQMTKTATELKGLFTADAATAKGKPYHQRIDDAVAEHSEYVRLPLSNVQATLGRFNSDADAFRRIAARNARKANQ